MSGRPNTYLNWTDGAPSKVQQPPANFLLEGWDPGQAPPSEYFNWIIWLTDKWIQYLDQLTNTGIPDQAIRLINGGQWGFVASTNMFLWSQAANIAIPGCADSSNQVGAGSVTLLDGQVAYLEANLPVIANGTTTNGSALVTNMNFTGNLTVGMSVVGAGIPVATTVLAVSGTGVQLSNNATADAVGATLLFSAASALTMQVADASTFIAADFNTLIVARRVGKEVHVGINANVMTLLDGEFKKIGETGYLQTHQPLAGENLTAGQPVYISPGPLLDSGRTLGRAYKLDCSAGNSVRSYYAGMVTTTTVAGSAVQLTFSGFFSGTGLLAGQLYYGDPLTVGGIVAGRPSTLGASIMPIGIALSSTVLLLTNAEGIPAAPQNQNIFIEDELGFGPTAVFTTSQTPLNQDSTFVFVNGGALAKSAFTLVGSTITILGGVGAGQKVEAQYIQANSLSIAAIQEEPSTANRITYQLTGLPLNQQSTFVFVDGEKIAASGYSLVLGLTTGQIVFPAALAPGQKVLVSYIQNVAAGGGGGGSGVIGGTNEGSGVPIFDNVVAQVMRFFSLKAGANISLTPDGLGSIIVAATGGGGGGLTRAIYPSNGILGTPNTFVPSVGLAPGAEDYQTWFLETSGGQQIVTGTPQIANGTLVGQRLTLRGVDSVNYYTFQGNAGTIVLGLSLNGPCDITDNQALVVEWDGSSWYEVTRRF